MKTQPRGSLRSPSWARLRMRGCFVLGTAVLTLTLAACGDDEPRGVPVTYVVSENFGGHIIDEKMVDKLGKAPTVIRVLQREYDDVKTSYGGRFVLSIAGRGAKADPPTDWIFYVSGRESDRGAADIRLRPGDHVQWDIHRWDASKSMTRTVGAFPRSLKDVPKPVALICIEEREACRLTRASLVSAGVKFEEGAGRRTRDTVVVGEWQQITKREGVPDLEAGPQVSGIFASFERDRLVLRRADGEPELNFGAGAGLIAAVERADDGTTWVIAGVDSEGTQRAARLLNHETLKNRFAVAADEEGVTSLPVDGPG